MKVRGAELICGILVIGAVLPVPAGSRGTEETEEGLTHEEKTAPGLHNPTRRKPRPIRFQDVVSGEDRTYEVLRGLAAQGLLCGYTARDFAGESEQLFTRGEIGQILAPAVNDLRASSPLRSEAGAPPAAPAWNTSAVWGLRTLLPGYRRELEAAGVDYHATMEAVQARLESADARQGQPGFLSGLGESRLGLNADAAHDGRWVVSAGRAFNDRGGMWLTLTNEREDEGMRWRERPTVNRLLVEVELSAQDRLIIGRDTMRWGPGYNGSLLLSENAVPVDHIRYERDPLKIFQHPFFFTQFFTTYREGDRRQWITGRRLATSLSPTTEVAYSEVLKMQSARHAGPSLVYVPLHLVQEDIFGWVPSLNDSEDPQSNMLASLEISTGVAPTATAHFQWLLDDLTTIDPVPRKIGWQIGGHWWREQEENRTDLRLEYTFTDADVYEHRQPPAAWFYEGQVLGHRAGPDSQDLFLRLRNSLSPEEDVTFVYNWGRHGHSLRPTEEHPDQAPERETLWSLAYSRDFTPHLSAGARYLHHRRSNAGQTRGVKQTEDRLWLEVRYGF